MASRSTAVDEIRDPETIGLPKPVTPERRRVSAFERSISA